LYNYVLLLILTSFYPLIVGAEGLYLITSNDTHTHTLTLDRLSLNEESVRCRDLYLNPQHSQETDIQAPGEIRKCNPSKRATADPRLRTCGHWDNNHTVKYKFRFLFNKS
jgi:hypothetical protein